MSEEYPIVEIIISREWVKSIERDPSDGVLWIITLEDDFMFTDATSVKIFFTLKYAEVRTKRKHVMKK